MKFKDLTLRFLVVTVALIIVSGLTASDLFAKEKEEAGAKILAKIGDKVITDADLEAELEQIPVYARKRFLKKEGKKDILDKMIKDELLYQAALDKKLDQDPEIKKNLENMRKRILSNAYFTKYIRNKTRADEEAIKKYYEEHKSEYRIPPKVKIRHILVSSKNKAEEIKSKLEKGADFKELAKSESIHEPTKSNGGYIGWVTENGNVPYLGNVPEITDVIFKLEKDDITGPIKTIKGYHIIKIEDKKSEEYRDIEQVKNQISDALMVSDEEIEKYYKEHPDKYKQDARIKISHIQFDTKEDAEKVLKELKNNASFTEMAKVYSKDKSSANSGGSLGYVKKNGYIRGIGKNPEITQALFQLEEGELSEVLQSKKGYHIFKIDTKEPERLKPLAEVRTLVRNQLLRKRKEENLDKAFEDLKKKYDCVVYYDQLTDSPEAALKDDEEQKGLPGLFTKP